MRHALLGFNWYLYVVSILGVGDGFPVPRGKMVRFRRKAMGMRDVLPRGRRNASPTRGWEVGRIRRGVVRGWEVLLHTSSVKNQRFLTASPQGEAKGAAAPEEGFGVRGGREVFGTGDPSPTRGREVGRIRRGVGQIREIVLRQSLRLPVRADTSLYTREALGCGGGREALRACCRAQRI